MAANDSDTSPFGSACIKPKKTELPCMDMPSQVQKAEQEARAELAKMISLPEDLEDIERLRSVVKEKIAVNKSKLSTTVSSQVGEVRAALELLQDSKASVKILQENFKTIDGLCHEISSLVENHDSVDLLNTVKRNMEVTIQNVERTMAIPLDARAALEMLEAGGSDQMMHAFEAIRAVDERRRLVCSEVVGLSGNSSEVMHHLGSHLQEVDRYRKRMETTLWSHCYDFMRLSLEDPTTLIRTMEVVRMQEEVDRLSLRDHSTFGDKDPYIPRRYMHQALEHIRSAVAADFDKHLNHLDKHIDSDIAYALNQANVVCARLTAIFDHAAPCFPPQANFFQQVVSEYHTHVSALLDRLAGQVDEMANKEILQILRWASNFSQHLQDLGVPTESADLFQSDDEPDSTQEEEVLGTVEVSPPTQGAQPSNPFLDPPTGEESLVESTENAEPQTLSLEAFMAGAGSSQDVGGGADKNDSTNPFLAATDAMGSRGTLQKSKPQQHSTPPVTPPRKTMPEGLRRLCSAYFENMAEHMAVIVERIAQTLQRCQPAQMCTSGSTSGPRPDGGGSGGSDTRLVSPAAVDLFALLDVNVDALEGSQTPWLLQNLVRVSTDAILHFQNLQRAWIQVASGHQASDPLTLEQLCMLVNTNTQAYDLATNFMDSLENQIEIPSQVDVSPLDSASQGFLDIAKRTQGEVVDFIFSDEGMVSNISLLCQREWAVGAVFDTLVETLKDYFGDLYRYLEPGSFKRVAVGVLERLVNEYTSRLLSKSTGQAERVEVANRMERDEALILQLYEPILKNDKVMPHLSKISELRGLVSAADASSFMLSYNLVLGDSPHITPKVVERLLNSRDDWSKKDRAETLEACQSFYSEKMKARNNMNSSQNGASGDGGDVQQIVMKAAAKFKLQRSKTESFVPEVDKSNPFV